MDMVDAPWGDGASAGAAVGRAMRPIRFDDRECGEHKRGPVDFLIPSI